MGPSSPDKGGGGKNPFFFFRVVTHTYVDGPCVGFHPTNPLVDKQVPYNQDRGSGETSKILGLSARPWRENQPGHPGQKKRATCLVCIYANRGGPRVLSLGSSAVRPKATPRFLCTLVLCQVIGSQNQPGQIFHLASPVAASIAIF